MGLILLPDGNRQIPKWVVSVALGSGGVLGLGDVDPAVSSFLEASVYGAIESYCVKLLTGGFYYYCYYYYYYIVLPIYISEGRLDNRNTSLSNVIQINNTTRHILRHFPTFESTPL